MSQKIHKDNTLPGKVVERLSLYRRVLLQIKNQKMIYSYELANLAKTNPAQVRRDIMATEYSGNPRKGYSICHLVNCISNILDPVYTQNIAIAGFGRLGSAVINYFEEHKPQLKIIAAFDIDPSKIGSTIMGIKCYHNNQLLSIIKNNNIKIGIISTPGKAAEEIKNNFIAGGVNGIINFTTSPLKVPKNCYLEQIDLTVTLEKVTYFSKQMSKI